MLQASKAWAENIVDINSTKKATEIASLVIKNIFLDFEKISQAIPIQKETAHVNSKWAWTIEIQET